MDPHGQTTPKCPTCGRPLPEADAECSYCQKWQKRLGWDTAPREQRQRRRRNWMRRLGRGSEPVEPPPHGALPQPRAWENAEPVIREAGAPKPPLGWDGESAPVQPTEPPLPRRWRRVRAYVRQPAYLAFLSVSRNRVLVLTALAAMVVVGFVALRHRATHALHVAETDAARNSLPVLNRDLESATWLDLPTPPGHPDGVTIELFDSIRGGMTVGEVFALLGPGAVVSHAGDSQEDAMRITYGWRGDAACGRMVVVEFENGRAVARGKSTD